MTIIEKILFFMIILYLDIHYDVNTNFKIYYITRKELFFFFYLKRYFFNKNFNFVYFRFTFIYLLSQIEFTCLFFFFGSLQKWNTVYKIHTLNHLIHSSVRHHSISFLYLIITIFILLIYHYLSTKQQYIINRMFKILTYERYIRRLAYTGLTGAPCLSLLSMRSNLPRYSFV